jgi:hypothetical protein
MEVDSDTGNGDADEELRDTNDDQGGDYVSLSKKDFNGEHGEHEDKEDASVSSVSDDHYHPSSPRGESISLWDEGDNEGDDDDNAEKGNLLSGP